MAVALSQPQSIHLVAGFQLGSEDVRGVLRSKQVGIHVFIYLSLGPILQLLCALDESSALEEFEQN